MKKNHWIKSQCMKYFNFSIMDNENHKSETFGLLFWKVIRTFLKSTTIDLCKGEKKKKKKPSKAGTEISSPFYSWMMGDQRGEWNAGLELGEEPKEISKGLASFSKNDRNALLNRHIVVQMHPWKDIEASFTIVIYTFYILTKQQEKRERQILKRQIK